MTDTTAEQELREKLARIDRLRTDARLCESMHTHWMGHDGEIAEIYPVIVRRRWRSPQTTHSERVMPRGERDLFLHWLSDRALELYGEANEIAATLGDPQNGTT